MIHGNYDVIVVGAGPSGSITARTCASSGLRTLLVEREELLGIKVCAGGLRGDIIRKFKLDERVIERRIDSVQFFHRSRLVKELELYGFTVYRKIFDAYLAKKAEEAGAKVQISTQCLKVQPRKKTQRVILQTQGKLLSIESNAVVAADGFASAISRSFHGKPKRQDLALAVQYEFLSDRETKEDTMYMFFDEKWTKLGYGWIFPKEKGYTVGLTCLLSRVNIHQLIRNLNSFISFSSVSKILRKAKPESLQTGFIPIKPRHPICNGGVLFVGDAAGQVSPLLGEGIFFGMMAGEMAGIAIVEALEKGEIPRDFSEYEKRWENSHGKDLHRQSEALEALADMPHPTQTMANEIERKVFMREDEVSEII